jgi:hypothetical protein
VDELQIVPRKEPGTGIQELKKQAVIVRSRKILSCAYSLMLCFDSYFLFFIFE